MHWVILCFAMLVSCSDSTSPRESEEIFPITRSLYDRSTVFLEISDMDGTSSFVRAEVIVEDGRRLPWTVAVREFVETQEAWNNLILAVDPDPDATLPDPVPPTLEPSLGGVFIVDVDRFLIGSTVVIIVKI